MNRIITYAIHKDEGVVISRVGSEVAWPVLDYERIGESGDFSRPLVYHLEKMPVLSIPGTEWQRLRWTKKVPVKLKNRHRLFWGFAELPVTHR
jgi:hypothetical protein